MYTAEIKATYTWNHSYIYATGADSVYLLIEWNASEMSLNGTKLVSKRCARNVELNIWLEPGIKVVRTYGCEGNMGSPHSSLILPLGHLYTDMKQCVVIECSFKPHSACKRPVLSVQWRYKGSNSEKMKEQAVEEIFMNYTYNLGLLQKIGNFKVEKQVKLLKTSIIMREAIEIFELGDTEHAEFILRREGDELLLCAVQSGDLRLMEEAEKMYRIIELYGDTSRCCTRRICE